MTVPKLLVLVENRVELREGDREIGCSSADSKASEPDQSVNPLMERHPRLIQLEGLHRCP